MQVLSRLEELLQHPAVLQEALGVGQVSTSLASPLSVCKTGPFSAALVAVIALQQALDGASRLG